MDLNKATAKIIMGTLSALGLTFICLNTIIDYNYNVFVMCSVILFGTFTLISITNVLFSQIDMLVKRKEIRPVSVETAKSESNLTFSKFSNRPVKYIRGEYNGTKS